MKTDIRFYHLERSDLDRALPPLLSKVLQAGHRIVVKAADEREVERLNTHLWTYNPNSFLPHGARKDGRAEAQPIWLTHTDENPNEANVIVLVGGVSSDALDDFAVCCEVFNGRDEDAVRQARARWKTYKDEGYTLTYWQQGPKGWEQK